MLLFLFFVEVLDWERAVWIWVRLWVVMAAIGWGTVNGPNLVSAKSEKTISYHVVFVRLQKKKNYTPP